MVCTDRQTSRLLAALPERLGYILCSQLRIPFYKLINENDGEAFGGCVLER